VQEGWDLSGVVADYRRFIDDFTPLLALLRDPASAIAPQQAFVMRSLLIHAYRRVQLHDPMLPLELLPEGWPGAEAYALAQAIYRLVFARAEAHLMDVLRREDADAPEADASVLRQVRFGGPCHRSLSIPGRRPVQTPKHSTRHSFACSNHGNMAKAVLHDGSAARSPDAGDFCCHADFVLHFFLPNSNGKSQKTGI
jgi:hypothetical protein